MEIPIVRPISPGNSFFTFISDFCEDEASGVAANRAFHRLCSLMRKMKVASVVIENDLANIDTETLNSELAALRTYYGKDKVEIKVQRFTFVDVPIDVPIKLRELKDQNFLSSCILINFRENEGRWISYIFQAYVTMPRTNYKGCEIGNEIEAQLPLMNNYLHVMKSFSCAVAIGKNKIHTYNIKGTFFCQQNTVTSVCAHAAICMAVNNMKAEGIKFVTPEDINGILDIDHNYRKLILNSDFYRHSFAKVFDAFGLHEASIDFFDHQLKDYDSHIYKYIESGCPTLLVFSANDQGADHVIPIFGHTLNTDMWTPEAQVAYHEPQKLFDIYKSTSIWVDHFIIHDDNLGMYYCLPTHILKRPISLKKGRAFKAKFGIAVVPAGVKTSSKEAELAAISTLNELFRNLKETNISLDHWTERLISSYYETRTPRVVATRTLLIGREEYAKSLDKQDFEGNYFSEEDKSNLLKHLPERFWLSEVTLPDIFTANKHKIIDFFYSCDQPTTSSTRKWDRRWIQIRLPGALRLNTTQFHSMGLSVNSHYPLLRLEEGGCPPHEW